MGFLEQYGPWTLIIWGSEGVGAAFAGQLAMRGLNLFLVARKSVPLELLKRDLQARYPAREIRTLSADLSLEAEMRTIIDAVGDLEIGLLIHNAGAASQRKDFVDADLDINLRLVRLNIISKMHLAHHFGQAMKARQRGGILLMGSLSGTVGMSGLASYCGAKAFSWMFSESLWYELRPHGVHVLSYILGPVNTPALARNFPGAAGIGADPEIVAARGIACLADGPVVYTEDIEGLVQEIAKLPRREAVEMLVEKTIALND
jgi:short-subunit dehydrogenase